jgi:hypothetical protein
MDIFSDLSHARSYWTVHHDLKTRKECFEYQLTSTWYILQPVVFFSNEKSIFTIYHLHMKVEPLFLFCCVKDLTFMVSPKRHWLSSQDSFLWDDKIYSSSSAPRWHHKPRLSYKTGVRNYEWPHVFDWESTKGASVRLSWIGNLQIWSTM